MRRSITRLPWRQFARRPFRTFSPHLQEPPSQPPASHPPATASTKSSKPSDDATLASVFLPPQKIPQAASSLSSLPPDLLVEKTAFLPDPAIGSAKYEPALPRAPVPKGYNDRIYRVVAAMAKAGQDPSPTDLNDLFRMMEHDSPYGELKDEAVAVWIEMRKRGINPTQDGLRALFALTATTGDVITQDALVQALIEDKMYLDSHMLHSLIEGLILNNEVDRALLFIRDLRAQGVVPKRQTYNLLISTCSERHLPKETFNLLLDFKEAWGDASIPERDWWIVLEACAKDGYVQTSLNVHLQAYKQLTGTLHCWQTLRNVQNVEFPEGLCLRVLSVASKHGHPALAASVFDELAKLRVTWQEYHFLPLIEAYVHARDIRQAFIAINIMREYCVTPPYLAIMRVLVDSISVDTKSLDQAFFLLQDMKEREGHKVDIVAFHAILEGCVRLQDASRALSTYQEAAKFDITPDIETYNLTLGAISKLGHVELVMALLEDMKAARIAPNAQCFSLVILTFVLQPPPNYESAFNYLEEMKACGFIPPRGVYAAFIQKCVLANDDRAFGLLEDMKKWGYQVGPTEAWVKKTVAQLGDGRMRAFEQYQHRRIERMRPVREEEREAARNVISMLKEGNRADMDEYNKMKGIEKMKEEGLLV